MSVPVEQSELAKQAFAQLTPGEQQLVTEALELIARNPAVGNVIPTREHQSTIEFTYTTRMAHDSAEAITIAYQYTPGFGVTIAFYFPDPQVL